MTDVPVPLSALCLSPLNVRLNDEDAHAVEALARSIAEQGLLQPPLVHVVPSPPPAWALDEHGVPADFAVLAGGRRFRAMRRLVAEGTMRADDLVPVRVQDLSDSEIILLSLSENLLRKNLRPYEEDAAVVRAHFAGASLDDIARETGQTERWVRQRLRLGQLAPEVFAAYAAGEVAIELAQAYGATEDQSLQSAIWQHFTRSHFPHTPAAVRAMLHVGHADERRLLDFVGLDLFRQEGGRFELDLFADEAAERGRVATPGLLAAMVDAKLGTSRDELRTRVGRPDLQFLAEPPRAGHGGTDWQLAWQEAPPEALDPGCPDPIPDLPTGLAALLTVIEDGGCELTWWWPSREKKRESESLLVACADVRAARSMPAGSEPVGMAAEPTSVLATNEDSPACFDKYAGSTSAQSARAAVKDEHGFTADGLQGLRSLRRHLLRAMLVKDAVHGGDIARDWLTWAQLRSELNFRQGMAQTGLRPFANEFSCGDNEPRDVCEPWLNNTGADDLWQQAIRTVSSLPAFAEKHPEAAFAAWLEEPREIKRIAHAVLAGLAMARSANHAGWRIPVHDKVAEVIGASDTALRDVWTPDARFVGQMPKLKRLELVQDAVGTAQTTAWSKLKDAQVSQAVAEVLAGDPAWIHPLLTFNVPEPVGMAAEPTSAQATEKEPPVSKGSKGAKGAKDRTRTPELAA